MQGDEGTVFVFIDRNTAFSTGKRDTSFFSSYLSSCPETPMVVLNTGQIKTRF